MSARELVVLGTASQVPTVARNHNGYLVRWDGAGVLVDPGEGTQRQMLRAGVSGAEIDRICLTHLHGDHCLGLPGVLDRRLLDGATAPASLHFPAASADALERLRGASNPHAAALAVPAPVDVGPVPAPLGEVDGVAPLPGGARLLAAALEHRVPAVGYRIQEPDGVSLLPDALAARGVWGPDVGRLVRDGTLEAASGRVTLAEVSVPRRGQSLAVVMDTRVCEGAVELARDVDVLVIEATFLDADAELAAAYAHLTAREAGRIAAQAGARSLVLTHFSRRYGDSGEPFAVEAAAEFGGPVHAAEDLDVVPLPPRRVKPA
ncbi:MAG: ribonuclease Z [Kineosporiaceae bacterium]